MELSGVNVLSPDYLAVVILNDAVHQAMQWLRVRGVLIAVVRGDVGSRSS